MSAPFDDRETIAARILEEIEELLRAGQAVDLEAYRARYPGDFIELQRLFATLTALAELCDEEEKRTSS